MADHETVFTTREELDTYAAANLHSYIQTDAYTALVLLCYHRTIKKREIQFPEQLEWRPSPITYTIWSPECVEKIMQACKFN